MKNAIQTEKFVSGSVKAYGYIIVYGPGELVFIDRDMNQTRYKKTLKEHLILFLYNNPQTNFFFSKMGRHATIQN